ncbi:MAG: hypothetical protein HC911_04610 [Chloroflexaceae bacterium]|nr:hypothetical protein [Chloroflexaceae bacterium]
MAQHPIEITVFIDFMCPYTNRAAIWLDQVKQKLGERNFIVNWKYFSLEQSNLPAAVDDWKIWEQPENYTYPSPEWNSDHRGLLAFWAAEAARQQGDEAFNRFRGHLFSAIHKHSLSPRFRLTDRRKLEAVALEASLDLNQFLADFYNPKHLDALRRDHTEGVAKYSAFGVPTICFDDKNAIYLKLEEVPPLEDALPFFLNLRQSFTGRRWLAEIKRPNP